MIKQVYASTPTVGKFSIHFDLLHNHDEQRMLKALFGVCVILQVEKDESGRGQEYTATSDMFQPLKEGEEIPTYRIEFVYDGPFENQEYESNRTNSGAFGFVAIRQHILRVPTAALGHAFKSPTNVH